jgi:hypothetical protein
MRADTAYTPDLDAEICDLLSMGQSLRSICLADNMPDERTVRRWVQADHHGFAARYAVARDLGMDAMADELLEIADDGINDWMERKNQDGETVLVLNKENIARSRLRTDTRKWLMSKIASKRYGDKTAVEVSTAHGMQRVGGPAELVSDEALALALVDLGILPVLPEETEKK